MQPQENRTLLFYVCLDWKPPPFPYFKINVAVERQENAATVGIALVIHDFVGRTVASRFIPSTQRVKMLWRLGIYFLQFLLLLLL